jgi:hypothetical protein
MRPIAHVIHQIPGRVRLKLPNNRGDQAVFERLVEGLEGHAGVNEVTADSRTGSLLIHHAAPLADILSFAEQTDLFTLGDQLKWRDNLATRTRTHLRVLDERIARLSEGRLDLRSLLILIFLGLTLTQVLRGQILPPAGPLLWYTTRLLGTEDDSTKALDI